MYKHNIPWVCKETRSSDQLTLKSDFQNICINRRLIGSESRLQGTVSAAAPTKAAEED